MSGCRQELPIYIIVILFLWFNAFYLLPVSDFQQRNRKTKIEQQMCKIRYQS